MKHSFFIDISKKFDYFYRSILKFQNIFLLIAFLILTNACDNKNEPTPELPEPEVKTFKNPIFQPVFADPAILDNREQDGYFYAYATQDKWKIDGSTERRVPILRSNNLVNWTDMGNAFTNQPTWNNEANLYWAPDMEYRDGKYYMYYSLSVWGASNPALGVAISDSPTGPFTDLGKILDSNGSGVPNSIDPYFFTDSDGKTYIFWGSFNGIYGVPMESDGKTAKLNEKFQIAGNAFEAPYIFIKDGYYYFLGSVGSCCDAENSSYHVTVARSTSLSGPYLDKNGSDIMTAMDGYYYGNTDETKNVNALYKGRNIIAPGHNSEIITDDNGQDWIFYHAMLKLYYNLPNGSAKRPLFIDKVTWDTDGWPLIGTNGFPSEYEIEIPVFNK